MRTLLYLALFTFLSFKVSGLTKLQCTDTTGSIIPVQILTPGHRIEIESPNYPGSFDNIWLDCVWEIRALHGARVQVQLVDGRLNEACNDNILTVVDDSPKGSGSELEAPGRIVRCGQSTFPPADQEVTSDGVVTVRFKSTKNTGNARFRLVVSGAIPKACPAKTPNGCPYGPCCLGRDCCVINAAKKPQEIMSPNFPAPSKPGLNCQYKIVTAYGSQIALNFLKMDIRTDSNQACLSDYVLLEDPTDSPASLIGPRKTFCGQLLPNYPAPSILVSAGNSLVLKYHTDYSQSIKGGGFKATVTAVNPICNTMQFEYQYGEEVCNSTCGAPYVPPTDRRKQTTTTTTTVTPSTTSHLVNETCEESDVVYEGNDVQVLEDIPTWEQCAYNCRENDVCTHFSWTYKTCSLKNGDEGKREQSGTISGTSDCGVWATVPPTTPPPFTPVTMPSTTTTTPIPDLVNKTCEEIGVSYGYVRGEKAVRSVHSWEECAYLCRKNEDCESFTWYDEIVLEAFYIDVCVMKPKEGKISKQRGAVSGSKECGEWVPTTLPLTTEPPTRTLENNTCENVDYYHKGKALKTLENINSWEHCAHICRETNGCSFWSYITETFSIWYMVGQCALQESDEGLEEAPGMICGNAECGTWVPPTTPQPPTPELKNKTCGKFDEDVTGTPIKLIHHINSWEHCAYLCREDNRCEVWTWTSPQFPLDSFHGDCDLKEKDEGRREVKGTVSGTSDCGTWVIPTEPPTTTIPTTTTDPPTETIPTLPPRCSVVNMIIKVVNKKTRDPVPRANVTIQSKKIYETEIIPDLLATHITDYNGKVTEQGNLYGTYTITVLKINEDVELRKTVDLQIGPMDTTCTNPDEGCTVCEEEVLVMVEPENPIDNCTCTGEMTVLGEVSQLPIPDVCVSFTFLGLSPFIQPTFPPGSYVDVNERQLSLDSINNPEPECQLRTNINGKLKLDSTNKVGTYTITLSRNGYGTKEVQTSVGYDKDNKECNCDFQIHVNMTTPICDLEEKPVNLKVVVTNNDTMDYIEGADVFIEVVGVQGRTDINGSVVFPITENGKFRIQAIAPGMNEAFKVELISCDPHDCGKCNPIVSISMVPQRPESTIPPTEEPCDKPMKNFVTIFSIDKPNNVSVPYVTYNIAINGRYVATDYDVTKQKLQINLYENGIYLVEAKAPGYKPKSEEVTIHCNNTDCTDCIHTITLELEPDVCEETDFTVSVRDVGSNTPIEGALVGVYDASGYKWVDTKLETDVNGMVVVISPGKAKLHVSVDKEGYTSISGVKDVYCTQPCASCNAELKVKIKEKFCEQVEVGLEVTVNDEKSNPISGAVVKLKITSSAAGFAVGDNLQELRTFENGTAIAPIYERGTYLVEVTADNYEPMSQEIQIDNSTNCEKKIIPLEINLIEEKPELFCTKGLITVKVVDAVTKDALLGAKVTVFNNKGFTAIDVRLRPSGKAYIPVTTDGVYNIQVSKEGHEDAATKVSIQYPNKCQADAAIVLEEKTCPKTIMPVRVTDNVTDRAVPGALVKVILVKTKEGPTFTELDEPKYTDDNGTAYFKVPMNGVYRVEVTVDGYDNLEVPKDVHCNVEHCEGCAPNVVAIVNPSFCPEKSLKLIIMDCETNARISGAKVVTTLDTVGTEYPSITVDSSISENSGEIVIPLTENGIYNSIISVDGYVTMRNSFEVLVDKDKCDAFNPVDTVPICPPAKPGCTHVTLAWANNKDIDLNGFRVNKTNTNDTCSTKPSCCDHCKKEDCDGVTPSTDEGEGLNGTETITYCNTTDYSNMVYISDPTGEGEYLPTSGAKIVITLGEKEQVIRVDDTTRPEGAKYWLAGCLTTEATSFTFITINKFFDRQPDLEDPLTCYDRVKVDERRLSNIVLKNAQLRVNFYDANTNLPIAGAMAEASTPTESISRMASVYGKSIINVNKNGEYVIDATAKGYVGAENSVTIECADPDDVCTEVVAFSMVPEGRNGKVEIVLNWGDQADNLDLHTVQIHNVLSSIWCETYYNKKSGCSRTELDQDHYNGGGNGGEKITISPYPSGTVPFTYMIVVKDNSANKDQLEDSEGSIQISDGIKSLSRSLPKFGAATPEGANYWFAGCLRIVDKSFVFSPVDKLVRQNPYVTERLYCDNLFKKNPSSGIKPDDQFGDEVTMNVQLQLLNNRVGLPPVSVNIISVDNNGEEKTVREETIGANSLVKTPITTNGKYIIKVEGVGYTSTENVFNVQCQKLDRESCNPSFVVPLITVPDRPDQVKIVLSWKGPSGALSFQSKVVDSSTTMEQCVSSSQDKSTCIGRGSKLRDNYFEVEEYVKLMSGKAGTVLVKLSNALASDKENARITITDLKRTVTFKINMADYQGEDYWLPFCYFTDGETFRLNEDPVFFNKNSYDLYSHNYCARGFLPPQPAIQPTQPQKIWPFISGVTSPLEQKEACESVDYHHIGTPLKSVENIKSWEDCARFCRESYGCSFWSYFTERFVVDTMAGQCDLQKTNEGKRAAPGVTSGGAECGN